MKRWLLVGVLVGLCTAVLMAQYPDFGPYGKEEDGGGAGCPFTEACVADGYSMCWGTDDSTFCVGEYSSTVLRWAYDGASIASMGSTGSWYLADDLTCVDATLSGDLSAVNAGLSGDLTMDGDVTLTAGGTVQTTANGDLLLNAGTGLVTSASAINSCNGECPSWNACDGSAGEVCVEDELDVKGETTLGGQLTSRLRVAINNGSNNYGYFHPGLDDGIRMAVRVNSSNGGGNWIITTRSNYIKDHDHTPPSLDPTLIIHSRTSPDTDNTQWSSIQHNTSDMAIGVATGGVVVGTVRDGSDAKIKLDPSGCYAIKLLNSSGTTRQQGELVEADAETDGSFDLAEADATDPIGAILDTTCLNGDSCWLCISGRVKVLLKDSTACTRHYWCGTADVAGRADCTTATPPGAVAGHFKEIGHSIESVTAGTDELCEIVMHFL